MIKNYKLISKAIITKTTVIFNINNEIYIKFKIKIKIKIIVIIKIIYI